MKIAILMMQKNEEELLAKWIAYHSYLVGHDNLFIFDNGSSSKVTLDTIESVNNNGTHVITKYSKKADYENRGNIFCDFIKELDKKNYYDYYIPIDCDEFLACLDNEGVISCDKAALEYELLQYENSDGTLLIDSQYYNSSVSAYWFNKQPYRKCFFRKNTIDSLDQGFHWGKVTNSQTEVKTGLVHIHFHNKPYSIAKLHAEEKLRGRIDDFSLDTLSKYKGKGFHLVRYFTENEEKFVEGQIALNHIYSDSLINKLNCLNQKWPYLDQVRTTANKYGFSDSGSGFHKKLNVFRGSIDNISFVDDKLVICGWGIVRHAKSVTSIYLKVNKKHIIKIPIVERQHRSDVNEMLNVKGAQLGFVAAIDIRNLNYDSDQEIEGDILTYINYDSSFFEFDMRKHLKKFNYSLNTK